MLKVIELSTDRLPSPPEKGGAIERYVYQVSRELSRLGVEVHLISIGNDYRIERCDIYRHVYPSENLNLLEKITGELIARLTSELNRKLIYTSRILLQILLTIQKTFGDINVIHNHYFTTGFAPIVFKSLINREVLLINHYHNIPKDNIASLLLAKYYDLHLTVSSFVKKEVVRRLKIPSSKVHVVYNAIDTSKFKCDNSRRDRIREAYGIKKNEIVLLYVGRITPEKGVHHLVEMYRIVRTELRDHEISLLIVGPIGQFDLAKDRDAAYFNYIQKLIQRHNLQNVRYIGYVNDVADIYAVADLVIVPSIWQDPCPSTVLEALAFCKPVVAYPVGGIPELLGGLDYNFLAEKVEPRELAKRVINVIKNLDKINPKMLREYVERRFSVRAVVKTLKSLIETYLAK